MPAAKITADQMREIGRRYVAGEPTSTLAREFALASSSVRARLRRGGWRVLRSIGARPRRPLADRFWAKVNKAGPVLLPELGPCWLWTGATVRGGYGNFAVSRGQMRTAHRVSYELANGPVTANQYVLHRCDNPPCVNPAHLWVGNAKDNAQDAVGKGRMHYGDAHGLRKHPERAARGERIGGARLTEASVKNIRHRGSSGGMTAQAIATFYGVSRKAISNVINRRSWRHVD